MLSKEELIDLLLTDVDAFNQEMDGKPVDLTETDNVNALTINVVNVIAKATPTY